MRKKPTFDELARASLAESDLGPVRLPYVPPNDASFAISELRDMTNKIRNEDIIGRNTQTVVQQTADAAGVSPGVIEQMLAGTVAQTSSTEQSHAISVGSVPTPPCFPDEDATATA